MDVRQREVDIGRGAGRLALLDIGPARRAIDLVFSHANGLNGRTYLSLLAPLAARWRVLCLDLRGHGASTLVADPEGRADWHDLRDDLLALLDTEGLDSVVLAGHSLGATVSLLAAAERPARIAGLVLFEPVVMPPGAPGEPVESPLVVATRRRRTTFPDRASALAAYRGRGAFASWPEAVLADYVAAGFRDIDGGQVTLAAAPAWEVSNYVSQGHDARDALRRLRVPLTILKAEHGSTCALTAADLAAERLPGARIVTVPGATHFLPMERPVAFVAELSAALESRSAPDA